MTNFRALVNGLSEECIGSPVKVFDAKTGALKRIEPATIIENLPRAIRIRPNPHSRRGKPAK